VQDVPLAFIDLETTGLSPSRGHRACEVAVLRCQGYEPVDALQRLVCPERPMDPGAYAVHGISDEMLRDKPPFAAIADDLLEIMGDAVLVGHNLPFDLRFLAAEFARAGRSLPEVCGLDTLRLARRVYRAPSYGLEALARALGVRVVGRMHRAMGDVIATRGVFERIVDDVASWTMWWGWASDRFVTFSTFREARSHAAGHLSTPRPRSSAPLRHRAS